MDPSVPSLVTRDWMHGLTHRFDVERSGREKRQEAQE